MRLLLDECVPRPLKRDLPGHHVHTVVEMGWSTNRNGELLRLMLAERFVDQNIEFQQNVKASGVAVIVVVAQTNRLRELRLPAPRNLNAREKVKAGEIMRVGTFSTG